MNEYAAARTAMVDRQVRPSDVTSFPIIEAMLAVPREAFAPAEAKPIAYVDGPLPQGGGRYALEPRVFAKMLDGARIGPDDLILDLAPGLGYSTAVIARMCAAVIAVEPDEALAAAAAEALSANDVDNAMVRQGAPAEGDPAHGPFDAIFINGAIGEAPQALLDQLKDGGRLVAIAMDGANGRAEAIVRSGDRFSTRRLFDASAPLLPGFEKAVEFAL